MRQIEAWTRTTLPGRERKITGRLTRTRAVGYIRRDVALNGQLCDLAVQRPVA